MPDSRPDLILNGSTNPPPVNLKGAIRVQDDTLSAVLSDFARTMLTDFRIQAILDHLVLRIVDVLPITGAGVTLISPGTAPQYVAASGEAALRFERMQTELGQGPCLTAFLTGHHVTVPDLSLDGRYPEFGPAANAGGLAAVFTFPLRQGDHQLGALDLYRDTVGPLSHVDLNAAQTLADVASAYLLNAQAREHASEASERFRALSLHDALTGLPNRVLLEERIDHAAARAARSPSSAAVLFVDLDRFKRVNDLYGHASGDQLLAAVAARLAALVRPGDTLARVSGDEFVFLCEDLRDPADSEALAERIKASFASPFRLPGIEIHISASVGIAYTGPTRAISYELVLDADAAMYQAKRTGGDRHHLVDLQAARHARADNHLEEDLRHALHQDALAVHYQPIVRLPTGVVSGVEALLRWSRPEAGPVPPQTAIGLAERSGLIIDIGEWVLASACRARSRWLANHPNQPLDLSVNVSGRELLSVGFVSSVATALETAHMDPGALVLEVTEGIFIEAGEHSLSVLSGLKALGVRLALDDFGTGYSSMNYLRRFPVDIVKIDQRFVSDLDRDATSAAIVSAVTHLAHALGMTVVAEGVENDQQRDRLIDLGCEFAQGFLFSHPLTLSEMSSTLLTGTGQPATLP